MEIVIALLCKQFFTQAVRKELRRAADQQPSMITTVGMVAVSLL